MPPIFAYSSLVSDEVLMQTKNVGFLDCISAPLTTKIVEEIVS
jgi:hypothetical protein